MQNPSNARSEENPETNRSADRRTGAPTVVMVVEDEFFIRMMVADELRRAGFQVIEFSSADEAIQLLRSGIMVSVVFTDIHMPGSLNGILLARAVRDQFPASKIILTSSQLPAGGFSTTDLFIPKPYDPLKVVGAIEALLTEN
jgi:CheY-like chemotaxis protein